MTEMTAEKIKKFIREKPPGFTRLEKNLFLRISNEGTPTFVYKFKLFGVQKTMTLGRAGYDNDDEMTLAEAREELGKHRKLVDQGIDPLFERKRIKSKPVKTFDDLANDWLQEECVSLKHPDIPKRIYRKEIKRHIGGMSIDRIEGPDIRNILKTVRKSNRPSIANDTLLHLKQIFSHGIRMGYSKNNPAAAFRNKHAGGTEHSRVRYLTIEEIDTTFTILRKNSSRFVPENYIAMCLLLLLGVRKTELTQAVWGEFNLEEEYWRLPAERSKTGVELKIGLPWQVVIILKSLRPEAAKSEDFVFPTRRSGKKGHISDDTLNHAVAKLFGKKTGKEKKPPEDILRPAGVEHFVIHDLRRTCRTLMEMIGIEEKVTERCLNHKIKGVRGVYNRHDYYEERKEALQKLAYLLFNYIDHPELF